MRVDVFKRSDDMKMEMLRYILEHYDHNYRFDMPSVILDSSRIYIEENNHILGFVKDHIKINRNKYFTLKDAKEIYKNSQYYTGKIGNLKTELQKTLNVVCEERSRIDGVLLSHVFKGFEITYQAKLEDDDLD